jgi:lipopolysaccharide transport system permease protein
VSQETTATPGPAAESTKIAAPARWPALELGELWRYRSVGTALAMRNLKARYRQTLLGVAWILIQPLALGLIMAFFFSLIARDGYYDVPFAVWFITGLAIWGPLTKIMNEGAISLVSNQNLVTRVYLPRPLIPISVALTTLVDLAFTMVAAFVVLLLFGYRPSALYVLLPFFIAVGYVTMIGAGLFLGALNVAFRDVQVAIPFIERLLFFMSPLLYPAHLVPEELWPLYYLNPLALVLTGFHWILVQAPAPPPFAFVEGTVMAFASLAIGFIVFRKREPTFTDVL